MPLVVLLAACGPHLDSDGTCVAPLEGVERCPSLADCVEEGEDQACQQYTVRYCPAEAGTDDLYWCDGDGNVVAHSRTGDSASYCDGASSEMRWGTPPVECTGEL